jgi:hypothetical protein
MVDVESDEPDIKLKVEIGKFIIGTSVKKVDY